MRSSRGGRRVGSRAFGGDQAIDRSACDDAGVRIIMNASNREIILLGPMKPLIVKGLEAIGTLHKSAEAKDLQSFYASHADVRAIACAATSEYLGDAFIQRFPKLQIISSFGVGYDHIDAKAAGARGVIVTNTPEVLTEEVADTALALLLNTVREFPQAERYLRAGKWLQKTYPLTKATLRNRTVGILGMGAIGQAIARRLDAFGVPVVYHARKLRPEVSYRHYPKLLDMAHEVDTLMVIVPGGAATANMINAEVLDALGSNGILINMARGSVVDEPEVTPQLMAMDNVLLFPHLGSASVSTRDRMAPLVVENIAACVAGTPP